MQEISPLRLKSSVEMQLDADVLLLPGAWGAGEGSTVMQGPTGVAMSVSCLSSVKSIQLKIICIPEKLSFHIRM